MRGKAINNLYKSEFHMEIMEDFNSSIKQIITPLSNVQIK